MRKLFNFTNEQMPDPRRRAFLRNAGGSLAAGTILLASCKKSSDDNATPAAGSVNLGTGDTGILNYAFALEQLEAAFYAQVVANSKFNTIFSTNAGGINEQGFFEDIRDHEKAHREFFRKAIPDANRIKDLTPDFSSIDFTNRDSILGAAKAFEDLGVSAYNGAGPLITSPAYLTLAGKIVSVEARHAAFIREIIANGKNTFVNNDVVRSDYSRATADLTSRSPIGPNPPTAADLGFSTTNNGTEIERKPLDVLNIAKKYIKETIDASGLPTN